MKHSEESSTDLMMEIKHAIDELIIRLSRLDHQSNISPETWDDLGNFPCSARGDAEATRQLPDKILFPWLAALWHMANPQVDFDLFDINFSDCESIESDQPIRDEDWVDGGDEKNDDDDCEDRPDWDDEDEYE